MGTSFPHLCRNVKVLLLSSGEERERVAGSFFMHFTVSTVFSAGNNIQFKGFLMVKGILCHWILKVHVNKIT